MAYYHITNPKVIGAYEAFWKEKRKQHKAFVKVLEHFDAATGILTDGGLEGIDMPTDWKKKHDASLWTAVDDEGCFRPKERIKGAENLRKLFATVPRISDKELNEALNFKVVWNGKKGRVARSPGLERLKGKVYIAHTSDWVVPKWKRPPGIKEITVSRYLKLGGKVE